jgi:hypothetical protein
MSVMGNSNMPNYFGLACLAFLLTGTNAVLAQQACSPHCDYTHYYGPLDFSYAQPGLFGHPHCGPQGDCAPHLSYAMGLLRPVVTVQFPRVMTAPRHPR